jgi:hypothetical protein
MNVGLRLAVIDKFVVSLRLHDDPRFPKQGPAEINMFTRYVLVYLQDATADIGIRNLLGSECDKRLFNHHSSIIL